MFLFSLIFALFFNIELHLPNPHEFYILTFCLIVLSITENGNSEAKVFLFFVMGLGFELRASCLESRCSTA
jgi:hypothetical protein